MPATESSADDEDPTYVLTDGDGDPIPDEEYDDRDAAIDARAILMGEREDDVTVEEKAALTATRKHLYLVTDHYNDAAIGCVEFTDSRHETVTKNEAGDVYVINSETHERKQYTVVGLGYHDFESEQDYEDRAGEVMEAKLAEIDAEHLEKAGVELEGSEVPA